MPLQVASLAASAGVGGGAFFVPLFMVCVGFGELLSLHEQQQLSAEMPLSQPGIDADTCMLLLLRRAEDRHRALSSSHRCCVPRLHLL